MRSFPHNPQPGLHPLRLQRIPEFLALLPRNQIVSGAMDQVCRRAICVPLYLGPADLWKRFVRRRAGRDWCNQCRRLCFGGRRRIWTEEDEEGLAFPVHVQDDAGARVGGRHPAADFQVLGRDVVACDLGSASMFRSTVGRELGKGGH